ncbi:ABC transporter [Erysipelotrichaceae bacterium I46]|uniref:ABC transporter ATP-binding protein n=1 Tax=Clostridium innocuum TaxID=1522 RepID=UPI00080CBA4F|nr:ABC transporter ATP-binding protein [[Clostridium] innocuum]ANU71010.1 ABC transporter [Erysipelotrichaceae bacterium I46]ASU20504.1 ABC transporter ATP-binding protein [[Clostridium] innocuum]QQR25120.1 ABC transporter ATP-binding protein [[Clostridium] innocuum]
MSILKLEQVSYRYDGSKINVLKNIDIELERGVLYTIIGKSGAGKSNLLSIISGLDTPTEGRIIYNGQDMKNLDRDLYRSQSIGVIFQGYNLLTNATALDNIVLAMNISGSKIKNKKEEALLYLDKVGIRKEQALRKVLKLSGGEQQRIGIARALSHQPDVIIADEPTGNLDPETEQNIMEILQKLAHEENKGNVKNYV